MIWTQHCKYISRVGNRLNWASVGQGVFWAGYTHKVAGSYEELSWTFLTHRHITAEGDDREFGLVCGGQMQKCLTQLTCHFPLRLFYCLILRKMFAKTETHM